MNKQVSGCKDCPFRYSHDMTGGSGCRADDMIRGKEAITNPRSINHNRMYEPIDPIWCPLKNEVISIKLKNKVKKAIK